MRSIQSTIKDYLKKSYSTIIIPTNIYNKTLLLFVTHVGYLSLRPQKNFYIHFFYYFVDFVEEKPTKEHRKCIYDTFFVSSLLRQIHTVVLFRRFCRSLSTFALSLLVRQVKKVGKKCDVKVVRERECVVEGKRVTTCVVQ